MCVCVCVLSSFGLQKSFQISYVDLSHNEFGEEAGELLGAALGEGPSCSSGAALDRGTVCPCMSIAKEALSDL